MKLAERITTLQGTGIFESKEIWQMTKAEYEKKFGGPKGNTTVTGGFHPHKSAVEIALNQGKKVPQNVLNDYECFKNKSLK